MSKPVLLVIRWKGEKMEKECGSTMGKEGRWWRTKMRGDTEECAYGRIEDNQ